MIDLETLTEALRETGGSWNHAGDGAAIHAQHVIAALARLAAPSAPSSGSYMAPEDYDIGANGAIIPREPSAPSSGDLDAAWREVESIVAETFGAAPSMGVEVPRGVSLRHGEEGAYYAWAETLNGRDRLDRDATGPTPAAALRALAARLASQSDCGESGE